MLLNPVRNLVFNLINISVKFTNKCQILLDHKSYRDELRKYPDTTVFIMIFRINRINKLNRKRFVNINIEFFKFERKIWYEAINFV